jgi:hypothetical protein
MAPLASNDVQKVGHLDVCCRSLDRPLRYARPTINNNELTTVTVYYAFVRHWTYPFLRILYHIPYHGQKSDIISYPISRLKKG